MEAVRQGPVVTNNVENAKREGYNMKEICNYESKQSSLEYFVDLSLCRLKKTEGEKREQKNRQTCT